MKRLTRKKTKGAKKNVTVKEICEKLADFEDLEELLGIPLEKLIEIFQQHIPEECQNPQKAIVLTNEDVNKWYEYKEKYPYKIGDIIYCIKRKHLFEYKITGFSVDKTGIWVIYGKHNVNDNRTYEHIFFAKEIGKTVFVNRDKAEEELNKILNTDKVEDD